MTWSEPEGFYFFAFFFSFWVNLGQDARVKYAEDGIIGSEAEDGECFLLNQWNSLTSVQCSAETDCK